MAKVSTTTDNPLWEVCKANPSTSYILHQSPLFINPALFPMIFDLNIPVFESFTICNVYDRLNFQFSFVLIMHVYALQTR